MLKYILLFFFIIFISFAGIIALAIVPNPLSSRNLDDIKAHAAETFKNDGFDVVGYQGYQYSLCYGAELWYTVKRPDSPVVYQGFLIKWGDEYHIYNLASLNKLNINE